MTQSSVAIAGDGGGWFLVNASTDLPAQIRAFPELQPGAEGLRGTPISAILLTNADLDHAEGLVSLREGGRLRVYAAGAVRETLERGLNLTNLLNAFCGVDWVEPSFSEFAPLVGRNGDEGTLDYRAIGLPGGPPAFSKGTNPDGVHSVAYQFKDRTTGGRLLIAPDVADWNEPLTEAMLASDAVLFDGTFWSGDELIRVKSGARTAAEMGHLPMQGGSLERLAGLPAARKIYLHINNTNPALSPGSPEQAAVVAAGVELAYDGMEFAL